MIVDCDGEFFLGVILADDVIVQVFFDSTRGGDVRSEALAESFAFFLADDVGAEIDTASTDVNLVRAFNYGSDVLVALAAETTIMITATGDIA